MHIFGVRVCLCIYIYKIMYMFVFTHTYDMFYSYLTLISLVREIFYINESQATLTEDNRIHDT